MLYAIQRHSLPPLYVPADANCPQLHLELQNGTRSDYIIHKSGQGANWELASLRMRAATLAAENNALRSHVRQLQEEMELLKHEKNVRPCLIILLVYRSERTGKGDVSIARMRRFWVANIWYCMHETRVTRLLS